MNTKPADYQCAAESGLQLLARLESRPSLMGLDEVIFDSGPSPSDTIEVTGEASAGKTYLITQILAKCLLPKENCGLNIGGLDAGAIMIDTDHHFQILKLVNMMESYITRSAALSNPRVSNVDPNTVENIIKDALDNLTILHCYDSIQLLITFHGLERILSTNRNISLLVLDSISAFYWQNTLNSGGIRKMDLYLRKTLSSLQKLVQEFKITIMYTKPSYFQSKVRESNNPYSTSKYGTVTRQIHLQKISNGMDNLLCARIASSSGKKVLHYEIDDDGIKWHSATRQEST